MRRPASTSSVGLRPVRRSLTCRLWCDEQLPSDLVDALWRGDVERLLYSSAPLQVKDRCIVARHDHAVGPLLVKRHTWGGLSRTVRSAWREASARRCGRLGPHLHRLGIPTPLPRACLEQRIGPWGYRSYLVTDYVEGTSLYRYIRFGSQTQDELRHVARQVARIWQRLVEAGISHNDMKPENFIVDEQLDVWLIDLEKVRLRGKAQRQRERNIFDVKNFLHIRGWHDRAEARDIFLDEFFNTPYGHWLPRSIAVDGVDTGLSVLMLCDERPDVSFTRRAIDSVRDFADEVVLAISSEDGGVDVLDRIDLCREEAATLPARSVARCPWVLALHADEAVTPFLAKELQQRIADESAKDAYRIPLEPQYFGRSVARAAGADGVPIRLFRQDRCSYSPASGSLAISVETARIGQLIGTIQKCVCSTVAEFVERLNEQTTHAATQRLQEGERPRLFHAMIRAIGRFLKLYARRGGIGSGWIGLQIALMEAVFTWIEEAKLYQLSAEFFIEPQAIAADGDMNSSVSETRLSSPQWDERAQRKAA